jgi:hypothetical protein
MGTSNFFCLPGPGTRSNSNTDPELKRWIGTTSRATGSNPRWPLVDIGDGVAEQMVVPTTYGILPVNMVRDERDVESEGEPFSGKHKQNVEQKVQEIFGQNL